VRNFKHREEQMIKGREALLKAEQVAELLNVRVSTVYDWVRMDYIPTYD